MARRTTTPDDPAVDQATDEAAAPPAEQQTEALAAPAVRLPGVTAAGILGRSAPVPVPLDTLAARLGVKPHILAGLKVEQGWNSETRVTEADFRARLNAWLSQPQGR